MNKKLVIYSFAGLVAAGAIAASGLTNSKVQNQDSQMPSMQQGDASMSGMQHGKNQIMPIEDIQQRLRQNSLLQETPKTSVKLLIDVQDSAGRAIANFDTFQQKLMHLIVVSDNLQFFSHLHPSYKGNGSFEVEANFPQPGSYTLFGDYKPSGEKEQVSVMKKQVAGDNKPATAIDFNSTKTFGDTKANLTFSQSKVKAGEEVTLMFNLQQNSNNQPVTDLQPYLGERGHLVILKQSSPLTRADYIHAHAMKDSPDGQVQFMTSFPQSGKYKLWGQFNRNGKIVIADFWVNVL